MASGCQISDASVALHAGRKYLVDFFFFFFFFLPLLVVYSGIQGGASMDNGRTRQSRIRHLSKCGQSVSQP